MNMELSTTATSNGKSLRSVHGCPQKNCVILLAKIFSPSKPMARGPLSLARSGYSSFRLSARCSMARSEREVRNTQALAASRRIRDPCTSRTSWPTVLQAHRHACHGVEMAVNSLAGEQDLHGSAPNLAYSIFPELYASPGPRTRAGCPRRRALSAARSGAGAASRRCEFHLRHGLVARAFDVPGPCRCRSWCG